MSLHTNLVLLVTFREEGELHPPCFHFWEWGISPKDMVVIFVNSSNPAVPQSPPKANSTHWFIQGSAGLTPLPVPGRAVRDGLGPHPTHHFTHLHLPHLEYFHPASYQPLELMGVINYPLPHWRER